MLRHVIPPTSRFTQVPNEIIRHPRLGSDAVRLLLWLLSLPDGTDLSLSAAAERAGMKHAAFQRAKRELTAEGFAHEWRRQGPRGQWTTTQLISNVPLEPAEAAAIRDGFKPTPPTAVKPAVGEPRGRSVGRHQDNTEEKIDLPPSRPSQPAPAPHPLAERGALALAAVTHAERQLRLTGREVRDLAPLAGEWLLRGASVRDLRDALTLGLPQPVHSAAGLIRDRLTRKMPEIPTVQQQIAATPPPLPQPLRSCAGGCGRMIRPVVDETHCRDCRSAEAEAAYDIPAGAVDAARRGASAVRAALRGDGLGKGAPWPPVTVRR